MPAHRDEQMDGGAGKPHDLAAGTVGFLSVWGLPIAVLVVSGSAGSDGIKLISWPLSLLWMGGACLFNALRCGRRHCFITGP